MKLNDYFEKYPNVSLRKLAMATKVNYGVLLKASKAPIPNTIYDPNATNWEAIEAKLTSKGIDLETLDWDALNISNPRRGTTLEKDIEAFKIGDKVYLRRDNTNPFEILYKTATHIVIMQEGCTEPHAWSIDTFLINGPVFEPRATKVEA